MKTVILSDVCDISSGGTPSRNNPEFFKGHIPWAKISDIENADGGIVYETEELISEDGLKNIRGKTFPKGTLLFAMYGSIGKTAIAGKELSTNQAILGIRPKGQGDISISYLKSWFECNKQKLINQGRGVALKNLSATIVRNLEIELPSLDDQIRIAHLLSKVEELIAQRKQHLQQLDNLLKSIFLEMFGFLDGTYVDWKIDILSAHTHVVSGVAKGKKYKEEELIEVPYMRVANVQDGHFSLAEVKMIAVTKKEVDQYQLMQGDLLLTEGGDPDKLGRGSVWEGQINNCIHQNHIFRVRINDQSEINPYYLSALVGSKYGKAYFLKSAKQTTGIASINSTQLKNFPTVIPPVDLQNKFATIVEKVEGIKAHYQQSFSELENLYGTLSQKAFKGVLDLSRIPSVREVVAGDTLGVQIEDTVDQKQAFIPLAGFNEYPLSNPKDREGVLRWSFDAFLKSAQKGEPLSLDDFWKKLSWQVIDYAQEGDRPFTPKDYDLVKEWLFDAIKSGQIQQTRNDIQINNKPALGNQVILKKAN